MSTRPLHAVMDAFAAGASSLDEVSRRTGLSRDMVSASVDHLIRLGRIDAKQMTMGCPSAGCGSCASGTDAGTPGCGADAPSTQRRGPVLVTLQVRHDR